MINSVACTAKMEPAAGAEYLYAVDVLTFVRDLPDNARITQVTRDFGSQRDPDVRLVGLRAAWTEVR